MGDWPASNNLEKLKCFVTQAYAAPNPDHIIQTFEHFLPCIENVVTTEGRYIDFC
jgi:hypothetical protein